VEVKPLDVNVTRPIDVGRFRRDPETDGRSERAAHRCAAGEPTGEGRRSADRHPRERSERGSVESAYAAAGGVSPDAAVGRVRSF